MVKTLTLRTGEVNKDYTVIALEYPSGEKIEYVKREEFNKLLNRAKEKITALKKENQELADHITLSGSETDVKVPYKSYNNAFFNTFLEYINYDTDKDDEDDKVIKLYLRLKKQIKKLEK